MAARKSVTNRQEEVDLFDLELDTILFPCRNFPHFECF